MFDNIEKTMNKNNIKILLIIIYYLLCGTYMSGKKK